ncbi:hypothetical protein BDV38DRAFT_275940 [Aspergillus pseudotamarii]|uniref:Major facilitator superfamily domain-containing protein n=1 Tax=Aspergillus pseudotamarii TaxID=132259 RepID=A0A5N6SCM6_ASPPS|nr:uncharacterized protein BDV38DRAFT_275940 [Aspergillus pseudotamarii]KAE8131440.1 hypothetical protein BDV38DRAFT_275940 [Aspergillus pseudotamarii]
MAEQPSSHSVSSTDIAVENKEKRIWYHSTLFNAFVIGGVGFMAPGLWNAMNSLGAGGAQSPFLINAANALVFGLRQRLVCACWSGSLWFVVSMRNPVDSYPFSYATTRAGLFWASEGAVALGYPEPTKRGRYMNSAEAKSKGKVDSQTYLIFVALQCLSIPLAIFLSPPEKVQRSDGSKVRIVLQDSWRAEMRELWKLSFRREVLLLLPIFWAAYFNQYSGNFTTYYFGVRARALIGFVSNFARLLSSGMISRFLDYRGITIKNRVTYSFFYVILVHIATWVYAWVIQEKYTANPPSYDWSDKGFTEGLFVILLWEFSQQALQNWLYYLVSTMTDNISELARYSGVLRGQESFAQAVSFGINTRNWYGGRVPLAVNTILLGLAAFPTWLVVRRYAPIEHDQQATVGQDEEQGPVRHSVGTDHGEKNIVRETVEAK